MVTTKKPSPTDQVVWLIRRKDNAMQELEKAKRNNQAGHIIYWQTIAVDAGLLLSMVTNDEYWTIIARRDASGLQKAVDQLDDKYESTPTYEEPERIAV